MSEKRKQLHWGDLLVLTVILFGYAIYTSFQYYLVLPEEILASEESITFSEEQNYLAFITQFVQLLLAFAYLKWRNFDFSRWVITFSGKAVVYGIGLFFLAALCVDLYFIAIYGLEEKLQPISFFTVLKQHLSFSLIIYAILNGFYEEIFFLGICLAVKPAQIKYAVIYSIIIRISFHTYQGLVSAVGLGIVIGLLFYFLYRKSVSKNLVPFFIAHTIADILGLEILGYIS